MLNFAFPYYYFFFELSFVGHFTHLWVICDLFWIKNILTPHLCAKFLDEENHLCLLDFTGAVLIEFGKNITKSSARELASRAHISKKVLHELQCLMLIKFTALVDIIFVPDLLDSGNNIFIFWDRLCIFYNRLKTLLVLSNSLHILYTILYIGFLNFLTFDYDTVLGPIRHWHRVIDDQSLLALILHGVEVVALICISFWKIYIHVHLLLFQICIQHNLFYRDAWCHAHIIILHFLNRFLTNLLRRNIFIVDSGLPLSDFSYFIKDVLVMNTWHLTAYIPPVASIQSHIL